MQSEKKQSLHRKGAQLEDWIKKGGREDAKKDFLKLLKKASNPQKPSKPSSFSNS